MTYTFKTGLLAGASLIAASMAAPAWALNETETTNEVAASDVITVVGQRQTYASSDVTEAMALQQSPVTNVIAQIDNLPGVNVNESDAFGFDDWSLSYSVRGFSVNLDQQQIGMTIDGLPNGNSNYGGGTKASRYIDSQNLAGIEVAQGTADIASRSNEALGGTLNFITSDPLEEQRVRLSASIGDHDSQRIYGRYDTGLLGDGRTALWVSFSTQEATDFMEGSAENTRDHFAAKLTTELAGFNITAYASYDDTHEDNYQRVYSAAFYEEFPMWDELIGDWTEVPYVNQAYRRGWSTLRENLFAYVQAEKEVMEGLTLSGAIYRHDNDGRGDWVPPYLRDVTDDQGGPSSEYLNQTVFGGPQLGRIYFVDANGVALDPIAGCQSSLTFPYGGGGAVYDPACYAPGAIPVQSYRHTHYQRERMGVTGDFEYETTFGDITSVTRGGIWYEDDHRYEYRDWHRIVDARVGPEFFNTPYSVEYNREYPQTTFKWYLEEELAFGPLTARLGLKQFSNEVERVDNFGDSQNVSLERDSDVLLSGGLAYAPTENLELFLGYAENYRAIPDGVLERPAADVVDLEPETSEVFEAGVRFNNGPITATATYFDTTFSNRLLFVDASTSTGPNYDIGSDGTYLNAGGLETQGIELAASWQATDSLSFYGAYTYIDASYLGTGDAAVDAVAGILPGNTVAGIPENMLVLSADWTGDLLSAGISAKMVDDRFVFADARQGNFVAESYTVADFYAAVSLEEVSDALRGADLRLTVNNLFDENYLGTVSTNSGAWVGAPRTTVLTVTVDF